MEAIHVGWCDGSDEKLEIAKRFGHDFVIEQLGDRRLGGVIWRLFQGDGALKTIDMLTSSTQSTRLRESYSRIRVLLTTEGGMLVISSAPGDPP